MGELLKSPFTDGSPAEPAKPPVNALDYLKKRYNSAGFEGSIATEGEFGLNLNVLAGVNDDVVLDEAQVYLLEMALGFFPSNNTKATIQSAVAISTFVNSCNSLVVGKQKDKQTGDNRVTQAERDQARDKLTHAMIDFSLRYPGRPVNEATLGDYLHEHFWVGLPENLKFRDMRTNSVILRRTVTGHSHVEVASIVTRSFNVLHRGRTRSFETVADANSVSSEEDFMEVGNIGEKTAKFLFRLVKGKPDTQKTV